jgi:orotate phosphoribosyltransferase
MADERVAPSVRPGEERVCSLVQGQRILLVDDTLTSGRAIASAAAALKSKEHRRWVG